MAEHNQIQIITKRQVRTAILVDGGFYRKKAYYHWGERSPVERANELFNYCMRLLRDDREHRLLYRIFYYDCPPSAKNVYHPLTKKTVNLKLSDQYKWTEAFFNELRHKRKVALRLGRLSENDLRYELTPETFRKLMNGSVQFSDIKEDDLRLNIVQKGVDMRIGVDMTSLALKKQVDQIILISGDSDFVPAAKQVRREGIDMILAPMGQKVKADLYEHIDGLIDRPLVKKEVVHNTMPKPQPEPEPALL